MMARAKLSRSTKATIASVVAAAVLIAGAWIIVRMLPPPGPPSIAAATDELTAVIDELERSIPEGMVIGATQASEIQPCPIDAARERVAIRRVIDVDPELNRTAWANTLDSVFPAEDGWGLTFQRISENDDQRVKLVGIDLSIYNIASVGDDDSAHITIRSTSECVAGDG